MNIPKVSFIVAVYNVEQYIQRCVDSLLGQTYANIEVVLVDDGSNDRSPAICEEYALKDKRVKVIHKQNGGVSSARQAGLDACTGEWVIHADPDDFVELDMVEKLLAAGNLSNVDMVTCDYFQNEKIRRPSYRDREELLLRVIVYVKNISMKTILRKIWNRLNSEITWARLGFYTHLVYYKRKPLAEFEPPIVGGQDCDFCDLAVVTFNNSEVVEYQIRTLRKFFKYPFRYTVFDNSTKKERSAEILAICKKYSVGYIKLPKQEFLPKGYGSYSHGIACNYLFNKFIKHGGAKFFMLLDHDIFLTADFDISKQFDTQFFYGTRHKCYIWPGLWAIPMDVILKHGVDFRPSLHLHGDTGACNYYHFFKGLDWSKCKLVEDRKLLLDDTDDDIFRNGYSLMDDCWLHCWNASDYMGKGVDNKMNRIFTMLEDKLR